MWFATTETMGTLKSDRVVASAVACAMAIAACGSSSHSVAAASRGLSLAHSELKVAECMRSHGVPNFPDPTSEGLSISPTSGIDLNSPQFLAAEKSCQKQNLTVGAWP